MTFHLGTMSSSRLQEVQVDLARTVRRAIELTEQDFQVFEGLRTIDRQRELVAAGASRTLDSYHLADKYGLSHAVDLVPFIAGRVQWQELPCLIVAKAMHRAAKFLSAPITWGGTWSLLADLDPDHLGDAVHQHVLRYKADHGRLPLVDLPHFQIPRT